MEHLLERITAKRDVSSFQRYFKYELPYLNLFCLISGKELVNIQVSYKKDRSNGELHYYFDDESEPYDVCKIYSFLEKKEKRDCSTQST